MFLIVIYKQKCSQSPTIKTLDLDGIPDSSLIVWDNSPEPYKRENKRYLKSRFNDFLYVSCVDNCPLSEVYIKVFRRAIKNKFTHVVLLDQDSLLSPYFSKKILADVNNSPLSVILPQVFVSDKLVSPAHNFLWFGWELSKIENVNFKYVFAVNSGVTIPCRYIDEFSFPVGLKNYGTDTYLFMFLRKVNAAFIINDNCIKHDLTFHKSNRDNISYLRSYNEHMRAMRLIFKRHKCHRVLFSFYESIHRLKTAIFRRDISFVRHICKK